MHTIVKRKVTEEEFLAYCLEHSLFTKVEIALALEELEISQPGDQAPRLKEDYQRRMRHHRREDHWIKRAGDWTLVVWRKYLQPVEFEDEETGQVRRVFPKIVYIEVIGAQGKALGSEFHFTVFRRGGVIQFRDGRKDASRSRISGTALTLKQVLEAMPCSRATCLEAIQEALSYFGVQA